MPSHAGVLDPYVEAWLATAARQLSVTAFGVSYLDAVVFWAAAHLEPQMISGVVPTVDSHGNICAVPKPDPEAPEVKVPRFDETSWWAAFLEIRGSRAAVAPRTILPPLRCGWRTC